VNGLYVFALTGAAVDPFETGEHRIEFVAIDQLGAGGEPTEGEVIYAAIERTGAPRALSEQALRDQHGIVMEISARVDAVLPARFGAFVQPDELRAVVMQRRATILDALALVKGRRQMTIRLLGRETRVQESVSAALSQTPTGTEYLQQRREALTPRPMPTVLAAIADAVRGKVRGERIEPGRGRVVATIYQLVDAADVLSYRAALEALDPLVAGDLALSVTGPWPPFAFAPEWWS
jgi:hypothetical protein